MPLKVRSMVGLLPICATSVIEPWQFRNIPETLRIFSERLRRMPQLFEAIHFPGSGARGVGDREIFALVNPERPRRVLSRVLDEQEFLSPYGIRSLSRHYAEHPYVLHVAGHDFPITYLPAESDSRMFGGNANWRGPIWMPLNALMIRALLSFYLYHGDDFKVECPTGSGQWMNLFEVAREIAARLTRIFLRDQHGRRAVFGGNARFQTDPHWKDYLPFHEYFHGDNGAGLGASHQTGWTGIVGRLIALFGRVDAATILTGGKRAAFFSGEPSPERPREPSSLVK